MALRQAPRSRKLAELETALLGAFTLWDSWGRQWQMVLSRVIAGRASSVTHRVIASVTGLAPDYASGTSAINRGETPTQPGQPDLNGNRT